MRKVKLIILPSNDPKDKIISRAWRTDGLVDKDAAYTKVWSGWPDGTDLPAVYLRLMWRLEGSGGMGLHPDNIIPETAVKMAVRDRSERLASHLLEGSAGK